MDSGDATDLRTIIDDMNMNIAFTVEAKQSLDNSMPLHSVTTVRSCSAAIEGLPIAGR